MKKKALGPVEAWFAQALRFPRVSNMGPIVYCQWLADHEYGAFDGRHFRPNRRWEDIRELISHLARL